MSGDTERTHETERMQNKYIKNDVLLPLPEEGERLEEGNSSVMEDVGSGISEEIKNSNKLPGKNDQIKGSETFSLTDIMQKSTGSSALNSATLRYHLLHSAGGDHPSSSSETRVPASRQHVQESNRL